MLIQRIWTINSPVDFDWSRGFQCFDVVRAWWAHSGKPQAKALWAKWVKYLAIQPNKYLVKWQEFIKNTSTNFPKEGDAIIFSQPSLTWHIAIVVEATVNWVKIYEQNAGKWWSLWIWSDAPRFRTTNYKNVMWRIRA